MTWSFSFQLPVGLGSAKTPRIAFEASQDLLLWASRTLFSLGQASAQLLLVVKQDPLFWGGMTHFFLGRAST